MSEGGVLQTEAAECGLACLATICLAHGRREGLSELRRRFPVSLVGTRLTDLMACADALGFSARAVRCDLEELGQLQTPAILHWNLDHYVVLRRAGRRYSTIFDPARGERTLPSSDVSRHFTGVALELNPASDFERKSAVERVRLGDLWGRLEGFRPFLAQILILSFFLQAIGLITPLISQVVIDDVIGRSDHELLLAVVIGFGTMIVVQAAVENLRGHIQLHAGQRMTVQLSGNLLRHLMRLPADFFERRHVGDVLSRFASLGPPQNFLTGGLVSILLDALLVMPVAVLMVLYSPQLSAIAVASLVVMFIARAAAFPVLRRLSEENLNLAARSETVFLETVRAMRAIKLGAREAERHGLWQNTVAEQQNAAFRLGRLALWGRSATALWQGLIGLTMLAVGALQVIDGRLTLGMFFAFQSYALQFSGRIGGLIGAYFTFRMLGLHLERLSDIVHTDAEPGLDGPAIGPRSLRGDVAVNGLRFRYGQFDPWVLDDVGFSIATGESVVIVGPSGGGKSTLLKLLMGLYPPTEGQVLFDGHPIGSLGLRAIRQGIGVVMQDDQLLSGSIADNVCFFDAVMDQERIERVCAAAHVHDDILRMPMGYQSLIGDMGSILSAGQKQRILLARALYRQPKILFMDEGTANLDPDLERRVMLSLSSLNITRIMVAHRHAAIKGADRALLVDKGMVTEATGSDLARFVATSSTDAAQ